MNDILFFTFLFITISGYYIQYNKIYINKSSYGISFNAYIVSFIATSSLCINSYSQKDYVFIISIIELILLLIGLFLIYIYKKNDFNEKFSFSFFISLFFAFFMIHGIAQAIKNFKTKGKINISINSYLLFISLDLIIIYLTTNKIIIFCSCITISVFIYIIIDTYIKNYIFQIK